MALLDKLPGHKPTVDSATESSGDSMSVDTQARVPSSDGGSEASSRPNPAPDCTERLLASHPSGELLQDRSARLPGSLTQLTALKLRYAANTQGGSEPGGIPKDNQDAWAVREFPGNNNCILFGVFDGHGPHGRRVSSALAADLPQMLVASNAWKLGQYAAACREVFSLCNKALCDSRAFDCSMSGSTGILAIVQNNKKLLVANVGDSRCFVGSVNGQGAVESCALSTDHNPDVVSEAQRIMAHKGRIGRYTYKGNAVGPRRVWLPDRPVPGLSMTRAFGDKLAASVGVIADPEIVEFQLGAHDKYLVLCSDGMFEFLSNQQIVGEVHALAQKGLGPQQISALLVATAREMWATEDGHVIDDCTIMVVFLEMVPVLRPRPVTIQLGQPGPFNQLHLHARAGGQPGSRTSSLDQLTPEPAGPKQGAEKPAGMRVRRQGSEELARLPLVSLPRAGSGIATLK